jgi:hypothetical protein
MARTTAPKDLPPDASTDDTTPLEPDGTDGSGHLPPHDPANLEQTAPATDEVRVEVRGDIITPDLLYVHANQYLTLNGASVKYDEKLRVADTVEVRDAIAAGALTLLDDDGDDEDTDEDDDSGDE